MIFGEIGKSANLEKFGRIEIWKTGNLEKGKFVKRESGKNENLKMEI